jgi:hypothetical protein
MAAVTARRTTIVAAVGVTAVVAILMLARGCDTSHTARPPAAPRLAQQQPTPATHRMSLKQSVVCVGEGERFARTPTRLDLHRMKRQTRKKKIAQGTLNPSMPSELKLHRLPNGTFVGKCLYGAGSPGPDNY